MSQETITLSAAAAVIQFLKHQFVDRDGIQHRLIAGVFGIFGHGNVAGLGQALEELGGSDLPFYQPKHEQSMVHTACAFAKAKKRLSTFACTSSVGPGATNMVTGAATATINRLPVLLLPGDIFANRIPNPVLQQLEYPLSPDVSVNDCFKPVSRLWDRINRPEQLLFTLPEAMRVLSSPSETGAVTIALPEDVQAESFPFPVNFFQNRVYRIDRPTAPDESLREAAHRIRNAKRPMILAGGGIHYSDACDALHQFVEKTGIPVGVTQAGVGSLTETNPLLLGAVGTTGNFACNATAREADCLLVVGTRLSDFTTASKTQFQNPAVHFVSINIHPMDAHKHGAFPLIGDARAVLQGLGKHLEGYRISDSYQQEILKNKDTWAARYARTVYPDHPAPDGKLFQSQVIRILNEFTDENAVVVHAAGSIPGDIHKLWRPKGHDTYHSEYGYSCMGYEIAGALGVKMAHPDREVYALLGDGSYLMLNHEIVTSIQESRKITVILSDNHGYQCIHNLQRGCGGNSFGNEFKYRTPDNMRLDGETLPVDYMGNARSLGAVTFAANNEEGFNEALRAAREATRTCLIYLQTSSESNIEDDSWWDVPVSDSSRLEGVRRARSDYEKRKTRQRFYY